jgi:hypothetical protein
MYFVQAVSSTAVFPQFNLATEPFALAETPHKIHKHDAKGEDHQILYRDMRYIYITQLHTFKNTNYS